MRIKRTDGNHSLIMEQLRKIGFSVRSLHVVGDGVPDLIAGRNGVNYLFEVKDPKQPPSKRKLTPDEQEFFDSWQGPVYVIEKIEDVLKIIG